MHSEKYNFEEIAFKIKQIGKKVGVSNIGITDIHCEHEANQYKKWLALQWHGEMKYLTKHFELRKYPNKLVPDTIRIICCALNYPRNKNNSHPIASFAHLQDYSTHICKLLKQYVVKIKKQIDLPINTRVFSGNGPVLEKALAAKAGIGWYGKNSLLLNKTFGSYFFLGEIFINIPLPIDQPLKNHCGTCTKCIDHCPTKALIEPGVLDATKCISYLTIEHKGIIPVHLRPLIGNKIFGCDKCQQACPWNIINKNTSTNFKSFEQFANNDLITWFLWEEKDFIKQTKNTPISRISYEQWLRNIAVALGNSSCTQTHIDALKKRLHYPSALVQEHVKWALTKIYSFTVI